MTLLLHMSPAGHERLQTQPGGPVQIHGQREARLVDRQSRLAICIALFPAAASLQTVIVVAHAHWMPMIGLAAIGPTLANCLCDVVPGQSAVPVLMTSDRFSAIDPRTAKTP